jgi:dihydroorotate dehydrogenase
LCGTFSLFSRLTEPFVDFVRYMPAPVFGALAVAVLGLGNEPKITIIFIGTFFQMVLIVANTTLSRPALASSDAGEAGGLSGAPLRELAQSVLGRFSAIAAGRLPLVGAGGIASGADAYARIRAGASAVQLYSALVFEGPGLAVRLSRDLAARLRADGFRSLAEAVGAS